MSAPMPAGASNPARAPSDGPSAASSITAAVLLQQLTVRVGALTLLDAIDLAVAAGERVGIIGPNGAGKSTLLKVLTGAAPGRISGSVHVLAQTPLPGTSRRSRQAQRQLMAQVGQIFQSLHLVPRLCALDNVLIGALARQRSPLSWARLFPAVEVRAARQALETVGMAPLAMVRADRLSGGQRQKVAVARLLLQRPRLILADEPTAALDPAAAAEVATHLTNCAQQGGAAMLTVVHEPALLPLLAERVLGMRAGRIVFDLPVAAVTAGVLADLYGGRVAPSA